MRPPHPPDSDLRNVSSPKVKNISLYKNSDLRDDCRRPGPTEGRFAIVTIRRAWDAMDAAISGVTARYPKGIGVRRPTKECRVRRNRVVLAPRSWRYVGGKSRRQRGQERPLPRGEHV